GVGEADDDQVAVHDGTGQAAAVAADPAVLLGQLALPQGLAVAVEAGEEALRAVPVDVAGGRVADEVGPAQADANDVGEEDVVAVLPQRLAAGRVQAHDALLLVDALAGPVVEVDPAVHDNRRRAAAVRHLPDQVAAGVLGVGGERLGQVV